MPFSEWLQLKQPAEELFLHKSLWAEEMRFMRLFNVHNSHIWLQDSPHAVRKRGYHGYHDRFSVSFRAGIVRNIDMGPSLLPGRLNAQRYNFLENAQAIILPGSDYPLMLRHFRRTQVSNRPNSFPESGMISRKTVKAKAKFVTRDGLSLFFTSLTRQVLVAKLVM
jgi:hypothetical protein